MPDQIKQLLDLAWRRCRTDIFSVIKLYIGMWVFLLAFVTFTIMQYSVNILPYGYKLQEIPDLFWVTQFAGLLLAGEFAFINTICTLTFIAIVVCLFEYALSFTTVCYYYDDGKWETVIQIKRFFRTIKSNIRSSQIKESQLNNEYMKQFKADIQKIKRG
jgi:hypothetical protein